MLKYGPMATRMQPTGNECVLVPLIYGPIKNNIIPPLRDEWIKVHLFSTWYFVQKRKIYCLTMKNF